MKTSEIFTIVEMVLSLVEAVPAVLEEVKHASVQFKAAEDDKAKAAVVVDGLENILTLVKQNL